MVSLRALGGIVSLAALLGTVTASQNHFNKLSIVNVSEPAFLVGKPFVMLNMTLGNGTGAERSYVSMHYDRAQNNVVFAPMEHAHMAPCVRLGETFTQQEISEAIEGTQASCVQFEGFVDVDSPTFETLEKLSVEDITEIFRESASGAHETLFAASSNSSSSISSDTTCALETLGASAASDELKWLAATASGVGFHHLQKRGWPIFVAIGLIMFLFGGCLAGSCKNH